MEGGSVRIWDWLIAISGLALAVGDFMPWYRSNAEDWTGWHSFMLIDKLMLITAAVAISVPIVAALKATDKQVQRLLIVTAVLGVLCLIFVIYRMATPADFDDPTFHFKVTLKAGAYVDLVASIVLVASTLLAMRTRLARRASVHS
jgi:hypothetical protein